jgi:pSer/pThr/pTyr-binding forkhead associated (FHA) protein
VLLSFRVFSPTDGESKMTFERPSVTVGRQRERSDIVLTNALIHREQGSFVWKDGVVFYIDFAGDARHEPGLPVDGDTVLNGLQTVRIGDAIVMPDSTRIVLKAVVEY